MDDSIRPLRVIQVEDNAQDAELVQRALARSGVFFSAQRVQTAGALIAALAHVEPDLVLCDYTLPQFDGKEALRIVREHAPHVPVVMVTGTLGDEAACELLKLGARDFVLKDRLARLGQAVQQALAVEKGIRARKAAEAAVRESEVKFRRLFESARDGLLILDAESGRILDANAAVEDLLVHARQDLIGRKLADVDALKALPGVEAIRRGVGSGKGAPVCITVHMAPDRAIELEAVFSRYCVGNGEHVMCGLRDVTDRRRAESSLRKSEALFRAIVENASDIFLITDALGTVRYASQAVARVAGYVPEGVVGTNLGQFVLPEERRDAEATWRRILTSPGAQVRAERQFKARDGSARWVESVSQNLLDDPALGGVVVVLRDITERKQAEAALRDSEVRFRALIESASDVIAVVDGKGIVQYVSPAVHVHAGYDPAEIVGRPFFDLVHADDVKAVGAKLGDLVGKRGGIVRTEQRYKDKSGQWHAMEVVARNLLDTPPIKGIVVNMRDVTERKAAEERLRLANLAVERSQTVVFRWREADDWPVTYVSDNVAQWGYDAGALMAEQRSYAALVHPGDVERVRHELARQLQAGASPMSFEYRIRTARNDWRWVEARATIERDGDRTYYQGTVVDITARRAAEAELRSSRASLAEAQAIARLGNWTLDIATQEIDWSTEAYIILGVERATFVPTYDSVMARIHPDDRPKAEAAVRDLSSHGTPMSLEHRIVMDDGKVRWVHERAIAIFDNDGKPLRLIGTVQDITERRMAQEALAETLARMELQLAGVGAASTAEALSAGDLDKLAPKLTEVAARTLGAARASVWLFNEAGTELRSVDIFEAATATHSSGMVVQEEDFREPFKAMRAARYIDAGDALNDPRTRDYADKFLKPRNIGAMLGVIVQVDGQRLGVLKIAHVGGTRAWKKDEIAFACQLADKIGFAVTTQRRRQVDEQLLRSNRALRTLSAGNTALVHLTDEAELYRQMCRVAVDIGGYGMAWVGLAEAGGPVRVTASASEPGLDAQDCVAAQLQEDGAVARALRDGAVQADRCAGRDCVVFPLKHDAETFGVLVIGQDGARMEADEQPVLVQLAADLAYGVRMLRTRAAHERSEVQLRETMEATIHAVAGTVERRDLYTAGHQRRVAVLATAIGRELGLPEDRLHGIGLAATIHDVGKIIVPAEILTKPGRLTPLEYDMVKQHAQAGYEIVKDVRFPWPIAEMVRQHHERMDGTGYPRGLKGDEILLEARIIGIADILEAIASHRPYRPSLGVEPALQEIEKGRGTKYDPQVVDACLRMFLEQGYQMPT